MEKTAQILAESQIVEMNEAEIVQALEKAAMQIRINLPLYEGHCQNHSSISGIYPVCENTQWTCGFWPGEIWLSYELTGEEIYEKAALKLVESFYDRITNQIEVAHHDGMSEIRSRG